MVFREQQIPEVVEVVQDGIVTLVLVVQALLSLVLHAQQRELLALRQLQQMDH
jgi:hypothetical protein